MLGIAGIDKQELINAEPDIELTDSQRQVLEKLAYSKKGALKKYFNKVATLEQKREMDGKKATDKGLTHDKAQKIAKLILADTRLAGQLEPTWLIHAAGVDYLLFHFAGVPMKQFLAGFQGSATATPLQFEKPYAGLSWKEVLNEQKTFSPACRRHRIG